MKATIYWLLLVTVLMLAGAVIATGDPWLLVAELLLVIFHAYLFGFSGLHEEEDMEES